MINNLKYPLNIDGEQYYLDTTLFTNTLSFISTSYNPYVKLIWIPSDIVWYFALVAL